MESGHIFSVLNMYYIWMFLWMFYQLATIEILYSILFIIRLYYYSAQPPGPGNSIYPGHWAFVTCRPSDKNVGFFRSILLVL